MKLLANLCWAVLSAEKGNGNGSGGGYGNSIADFKNYD